MLQLGSVSDLDPAGQVRQAGFMMDAAHVGAAAGNRAFSIVAFSTMAFSTVTFSTMAFSIVAFESAQWHSAQ